jgi:hypothetical protein
MNVKANAKAKATHLVSVIIVINCAGSHECIRRQTETNAQTQNF